MVERTLQTKFAFLVGAPLGLIGSGVVRLFLPAVTLITVLEVRAAFALTRDEGQRLPRAAHLRAVAEEVGPAAEILPVVGVDAVSFIMRGAIVRAPLGLKVVNVEGLVSGQLLDQSCLQIVVAVGERAKVSILTRNLRLRLAEVHTVLSFIFLRVV